MDLVWCLLKKDSAKSTIIVGFTVEFIMTRDT